MDKILARVGALTVTEAEVDAFLQGLGQRGAAYNNPEGRKIILEQLIGNKLLLQDAKRNLLEGEAAFREELAKLKENLLISYAGNKVISGVTISDKEVEDYYEENKEKFKGEKTVNASHILVDSEELAKELIAKIKAGEISFEDAAIEHSSCPSKENGGNLGDFGQGQMVPEFDQAVFSMEVGELSEEPVKTQFGYHVIKLNSKEDARIAPLAEIKDQLKEMLLGEKRRKAYESKINQLKIVYPVDLV
ncbi:MAG: peptidylprolyl isomerase [Clostridia bacterium]|nr:peptidylprolyl isomerase [Clostridia bacterium]